MLSQWLQQAKSGRSVWLSDVRRDCEALPEHVAVTMQLTLTDGTRRDFSLPIPRWEGAEQRQFAAHVAEPDAPAGLGLLQPLRKHKSSS